MTLVAVLTNIRPRVASAGFFCARGFETGNRAGYKRGVKTTSKHITLESVLPHRAVGEDHPGAKLTRDDVNQIRNLHERGATIMGLARAFTVSPPTIRSIIQGRTWKHVRKVSLPE